MLFGAGARVNELAHLAAVRGPAAWTLRLGRFLALGSEVSVVRFRLEEGRGSAAHSDDPARLRFSEVALGALACYVHDTERILSLSMSLLPTNSRSKGSHGQYWSYRENSNQA